MTSLALALVLAGSNGVGTGGLQGFQPVNAGNFTPSNAPNLVYATTAAITLYVDPTGSDSNDCTATGTAACLTIQGALNKVPKMLRHGVTVNVAAGTYGCFYVAGFTCDPSFQQTTGGLLVDATAALTASTLATGSATGTATSSAAGSGTTFGTLTDSGATWTINDLKGRFITSASQTRVISSNTATAITIVGTWTSPGAVAYTIQDPGVSINTACQNPASTQAAAAANNAAITIYDNNCGQRTNTIGVQGIRLSNAAGIGMVIADNSGIAVRVMQFRNLTSASAMQIGNTANGSPVASSGRIDLSDVDALSVSATVFNHSAARAIATRVLVRSGATGWQLNGPTASLAGTEVDFQGSTTPVFVGGGRLSSMSGSHVTCGSTGTGITVGGTSAQPLQQSASDSSASISGALVATCGIGLFVSGTAASADATGITGTAATTGMAATAGGAISFTSGTTITGGTQDINLDSGAATAALADVAINTCLATGSFGSKVCQR